MLGRAGAAMGIISRYAIGQPATQARKGIGRAHDGTTRSARD